MKFKFEFKGIDIVFLILFCFVFEVRFAKYFNPWHFIIFGIVSISLYHFIFRRKKLKNLNSFLFFILLILSLIALYSFLVGGFFDPGVPTFNDHPTHYLNEYIVTSKIIPVFKNTMGWVHTFAGGYVFLSNQPPVQSIMMFITNMFIPFALAYRTVYIFSFFLSVLTIFLFSKKISKNTTIALIAAILWISANHNHFFVGSYASYFGISFSLLMAYYYFDYIEGRKNSIYAMGLFAALAFNSYTVIMAITSFVLSVHFIFEKIYRRIRLRELTIPVILFLMSTTLYFSNFILVNKLMLYEPRQKMFSIWFDFKTQFLAFIPVVFIYLWLAFYPLLFFKQNRIYNLLSMILIIFIIASFLFFYLVNIELIPGIIAASKFIFFLEVFVIIISSYSIYMVMKSKIKVQHGYLLAVFFGLIAYNVFVSSYYFNAIVQKPSVYWDEYYDWSFEKVYKMKLEDGILSSNLKKETADIIERIKELNTTSRILFEDDWVSFNIGGGYEMPRLYFTGKKFVNPHYMIYPRGIDLEIQNGVIFGDRMNETSIDENKLQLFNVKYLVVWNQYTKKELKSNKDFLLIYDNGFYQIYEYKNSSSYLSIPGIVNFYDDKIDIEVLNGTKNEIVRLSSRYFDRWHAYYDGNEIKIFPVNETFVGFLSPKDGRYKVELVYEEGLMEKISKYVTLFTFLFLLIINISYYISGLDDRFKHIH